jgi:hypothetical protein
MTGSWQDEARDMPPPSDEEIAEWADGIVYGKTPGGIDVWFDPRSRFWRLVRRLGYGQKDRFEASSWQDTKN